jgi:hypothetical protein
MICEAFMGQPFVFVFVSCFVLGDDGASLA